MSFHVEYVPTALNELADVWMPADSEQRLAITRAARAIDVRLESDPMGKALPDQRLECPREGASCVKLDVAICSDGEDGHLVLLLGDVLEQHQRGVVCPVQVVQNVEQRQGMTYTLEKLAYAVEEI